MIICLTQNIVFFVYNLFIVCVQKVYLLTTFCISGGINNTLKGNKKIIIFPKDKKSFVYH